MMSAVDEIAIAVGSSNRAKKEAVFNGLKSVHQDSIINIHAFEVASGVSIQPFGDDETKLGAVNRAKSAYVEYQSLNDGLGPKYSVGIEGGVQANSNKQMECFAWIVIYNGQYESCSRTSTFLLPPAISKLVNEGVELGKADDEVFSRVESNQGSGTVGYLTHGIIDRCSYYSHAVVLAMIPFTNPELYDTGNLS